MAFVIACILAVLGLLPFACLLLTFVFFSTCSQNKIEALIKSSLVWGSSIALVTNILSVFSALHIKFVLIYWVLYAMAFIFATYKRSRKVKFNFNVTLNSLVLLLAMCITFIVALIYPPNNWDSMTYHLPKIMHWAQNETLAHYTTGISRQNDIAPFAEMIILQSYILSQTDYYMNLVQWCSYVGLIFVAIDTTSMLGANKKGQIAAAFFVATAPIIIAQASSTQTDNVVAFFLCCAINRLLVWKNEQNIQNATYFAMALGLAILTKGTTYLFALPLVCVVSFYGVVRFKTLFSQMIVIFSIVIVLNSPHLARNYISYNNILGTHANLGVKTPSAYTLGANIIANILSNIPVIGGTSQIENMYNKFIVWGEIDKKTFFPYGDIATRSRFTTHEDMAQNIFHTLSIVLMFILFMTRSIKLPLFYTLLILSSIITFCLFLTWQPWIVRLQVPIFTFCAPLFGICVEQIRSKQLQGMVLVLCWLSAPLSFFLNASRPLVPHGVVHSKPTIWQNTREELYFTNKVELYEEYRTAVDTLVQEKPKKIGLVLGGDTWEYPLWALLKKRVQIMPNIVHTPTQQDIDKAKPDYLFVHEAKLPGEQNSVGLFGIYRRSPSGYDKIF